MHDNNKSNYAQLSLAKESMALLQKKRIKKYASFSGKSLMSQISRLTFQYDPDEGDVIEDYMQTTEWEIVSDKLKLVIEQLQTSNLEFIPVSIINTKTKEVASQSFFAIVVTEFTDCFRRDMSTWFDMKSWISITHLAIDGNRVQNKNVLRIKETPHRLVVSELVYKKCKKEKLTGMSFGKVSVIYEN